MIPLESPEMAATLLTAIERAELGVTIVTNAGDQLRRVYSNRRFCELTGYRADELAAMPGSALLPPDERARHAEHQATLLATGVAPPVVETAIVARDGTVIPVELAMANVPFEGTTATVTFVRDIRERERIASALRESEARFRSLAEASPDTIVVSVNGRVRYANPAAARALGFEPDELRDRALDGILDDAAETAVMLDRLTRAAQGEHLSPREYAVRRKDGTSAIYEISTTPVTFDGAPALLSIGRDTAERRAWHAELMRSDRLAAIGMVAASVAHEVNNPLTYLLIHLERIGAMVATPGVLPAGAARDELAAAVSAARDGAARVRTIIRDLLSVARHDDQACAVSVASTLATAVKLAGPTLRERADLIQRTEEVPPVLANESRLSQVFLNLLLNAADAFDHDSQHNRIELEIARADPRVRISVIDNGRGIPPDQLARVFEPLFTTKPRGRGTGLGLSICKSIVAELGGEIAISSGVGVGTRIDVHLPRAPA